jgi:adenylate cyclase
MSSSAQAADGAAPIDATSADLLRSRVSKARHDLRNPISDILGFSEILQEEALERGQQRLLPELRVIHQRAAQILKELNQCLDFDALQSNRAGVRKLQQTIESGAPQIITAGETLSLTCDPAASGTLADDLARIIGSARRLLELAPALLPPLLEREKAATRHVRKAGPAGAPPGTPAASNAAAVAAPLPPTGTGVETLGGTVLVVDDDESNRALLSRRLRRQGYAVGVAENGRQALRMLKAQQFDLVLLDIMMPEVNGYQVLEQLKRDVSLRDIPVLVLSAVDDMQSVVRCIENGAQDYLPKPFDPVLLRARIGACLEKKRLHDRELSYLRQIEEERRRADDLLRVLLPEDVAQELKATKAVKPRRYENVGVLFCDIVDFTAFCDKHPAEEVLEHLQALVKVYEELTSRLGLEKIKTIGDAYMATAGLLAPVENATLWCVQCGLQMVAAANRMPARWQVHVGIHVGPVIAGVVGEKKYLFDVWGDTVNTASRVTSLAGPDSVFVSGQGWEQVKNFCEGHSCGLFQVKGKGQMEVFRVHAVRQGASPA